MSEVVRSLHTSADHKSKIWRVLALVLLVVLMLVILHWLLFQGQEVVPSMITRPLGSCDVDRFEKWGGAIVIACPHTDLIKVWPLPVQQPWYEDPFFPQVTAMHS